MCVCECAWMLFKQGVNACKCVGVLVCVCVYLYVYVCKNTRYGSSRNSVWLSFQLLSLLVRFYVCVCMHKYTCISVYVNSCTSAFLITYMICMHGHVALCMHAHTSHVIPRIYSYTHTSCLSNCILRHRFRTRTHLMSHMYVEKSHF